MVGQRGDRRGVLMIEDFLGRDASAGRITGEQICEEPAERGQLPDAPNPRGPVSGVNFIPEEDAEVVAIDEKLVRARDLATLDQAGECFLAGGVFWNIPFALGGSENFEEIVLREGRGEFGKGAILVLSLIHI